MKKATYHIQMRFCLLAMAIVPFLYPTSAYALEKNEELANFIYNLVDHIKWHNKSEVVLCAYGHDDIAVNLSNLDVNNARPSQLSGIKKININTAVDFEHVQSCDVLYIAQTEEKNAALLIDKVKNFPIITISAMENFVTMGGVLEFKVMRRKVQLKFGQEALERTGISLSPVILMSARPDSESSQE